MTQPTILTPDGWLPASHINLEDGGPFIPITDWDELWNKGTMEPDPGGDPGDPEPPVVTSVEPQIWLYTGGSNENPDQKMASYFGFTAKGTSHYNQTAKGSATNPWGLSYFKRLVDQGISIQATLTSKNETVDHIGLIAESRIGPGNYDRVLATGLDRQPLTLRTQARVDAAKAYITDYVTSFAKPLAEYALGKGVWTIFSYVSEPDVATNTARADHSITDWDSGQTFNFAKAQKFFSDELRRVCPSNAEFQIWLSGSRTTWIGEVFDHCRTLGVRYDQIGLDSYQNGPSTTFKDPFDVWKPDIDFVRGHRAFPYIGPSVGIPPQVALPETGLNRKNYNDSLAGTLDPYAMKTKSHRFAEFIRKIPDAARRHKVRYVTWFDRWSGPQGWQNFTGGLHNHDANSGTPDIYGNALPEAMNTWRWIMAQNTSNKTLVGVGAKTGMGDADALPNEIVDTSGGWMSWQNSGTRNPDGQKGDIVWLADDQGTPGRIVAVATNAAGTLMSGKIVARVALEGLENSNQFEELQGDIDGTLTIGRIGSGGGSPRYLYKIKEPYVYPDSADGAHDQTIPAAQIVRVPFNNGDFSDMEAFCIDPRTGHLFVFEKRTISTTVRPLRATEAGSQIFTSRVKIIRNYRAILTSPATITPFTMTQEIRSHDRTWKKDTGDAQNGGIVACAISANGEHFVWKNYQEWWYIRVNVAGGETLEQAIAARGASGGDGHWYHGQNDGSELIFFGTDRREPTYLYTKSESPDSPVNRWTLTWG